MPRTSKHKEPLVPPRFRNQNSRWTTHQDFRPSPASDLNDIAYRNARIAKDRGRLPSDLDLASSGAGLRFTVSTIESARIVDSWIELFLTNRAGL